jgi:hypothetical protein
MLMDQLTLALHHSSMIL